MGNDDSQDFSTDVMLPTPSWSFQRQPTGWPRHLHSHVSISEAARIHRGPDFVRQISEASSRTSWEPSRCLKKWRTCHRGRSCKELHVEIPKMRSDRKNTTLIRGLMRSEVNAISMVPEFSVLPRLIDAARTAIGNSGKRTSVTHDCRTH